jgi:hypothetical protein
MAFPESRPLASQFMVQILGGEWHAEPDHAHDVPHRRHVASASFIVPIP